MSFDNIIDGKNTSSFFASDAVFTGDTSDIAVNNSTTSPTVDENSKFVTKGQHLHKWGTYLGIDWILNTVTGVGLGYAAKYSEPGKKYWSGPITRGFTQALSKVLKNEEHIKLGADKGSMFMGIIAGGMFTIPPLMVMENKKVKKSIVESLDDKLYGEKKCDQDDRIKQAHDNIVESPKKDFFTGLGARLTALAPLLAMVLFPPSRKVSDKYWFNHVENASEWAAKKIGFSAEKSFKNLPVAQAQSRWKFIHESVAMDFGLGVPYAILHEFFYSKFASNKKTATSKADIATISEKRIEPEPIGPAEITTRHYTQIHKPSAGITTAPPPTNFVDKISYNFDSTASLPAMK